MTKNSQLSGKTQYLIHIKDHKKVICHWKKRLMISDVFEVGLKITITPTKPTNIAVHRLQPNFSPRKGTDKPATIRG